MNRLPLDNIRRHARGLLVILLVTGGTVATYRMWRTSRDWECTDNAYTDGPVHLLAARLVGTVQEVMVTENQRVSAGQTLLRLDPRDSRIQHDQQCAKLAEAEASLAAATANVARTQANARLSEATLKQADCDLERMTRLNATRRAALSTQDLEHARVNRDAAAASHQASQCSVVSAQAEEAVARAKVTASAAALAQAALQCEYTTLSAPVAGTVGRRSAEAGQPVVPSQPLLGLVGDDLWLTANFKETQLSRLRPGQAAWVRFDTLPGHEWPATVESLAPASGARFALLPPENATGNFTRVVQRVPVRIRLSTAARNALGPRLVPGLSAKVRVRVTAHIPDPEPISDAEFLTHQ